MIEQIVFAKNRGDLEAACRALDRILLWNHYVVPQWSYPLRADRALGPLRASRSDAEIRQGGVPDRVVVGRRQSREDGLIVIPEAAVRNPYHLSLTIHATSGIIDSGLAPSGRPERWITMIFSTYLTRRDALALTAGVAAASVRSRIRPARADDAVEAHGLSAFGDLGYPPDFDHFRYVDPHAPKGGTFSQIGPDRAYNQNFLTFNSLNSFILKGDAAQGLELTFATLMVRSGDEPDAMYGLAASKVRRSADGLSYQFFIRREAKFHDGSRLTAADVAFSLNILKEKGHPLISQSLRDFTGAKADDDTRVTVSFAPQARPRRAAVRRRLADFFARLLRDKAVR